MPMNAQDRSRSAGPSALLHDMHGSLLCMFNIELYVYIPCRALVLLNYIGWPTPKQDSGTILFRVAHDLRDGGRHQAMSLYKLKASVNYTVTVVTIDS